MKYKFMRHLLLSLFTILSCGYNNQNTEATGPKMETSGLKEGWDKIAIHLNEGSIKEAHQLASQQAWSSLLLIDVTQWEHYEWEEEVIDQEESKAIVRIRFQEADKPVVLMFCKSTGQWRFQGLYLYRMPWAYLKDSWETVLEKGFWTRQVPCN